MDIPALTMMFFGVLIVGTGATGLAAPQLLLSILGLSSSPSTQIFVMASSQASLALGLYYMLAAVYNTRAFFKWSVPIRIGNFVVFAGMVIFGTAPASWLLVAGLELTGALATGLALRYQKDGGARLSHFDVIRIASAALALIAAVPAFNWLGIYGSASAFLVVSSAGFVYAYQKFPSLDEIHNEISEERRQTE